MASRVAILLAVAVVLVIGFTLIADPFAPDDADPDQAATRHAASLQA
jgi:hypothetical protein